MNCTIEAAHRPPQTAPAKKTKESAKLAISEEEKLNMMIPFGLEKSPRSGEDSLSAKTVIDVNQPPKNMTMCGAATSRPTTSETITRLGMSKYVAMYATKRGTPTKTTQAVSARNESNLSDQSSPKRSDKIRKRQPTANKTEMMNNMINPSVVLDKRKTLLALIHYQTYWHRLGTSRFKEAAPLAGL
jgi:hypothetical protein